MKGRRVLLALTLAVLLVPLPAAAVTATSPDGAASTSVGSPIAQQNETAPSEPTFADRARVSAVQFSREYLSTERTGDQQFNTTGAYAVFAVSRTVETARVRQPGATAKVMDGGRTVRVEYDSDAATADSTSFFELELFFRDESNLTVALYASGTNQVVAPASLSKLSSFLDTVKTDAEDAGYDTDADGLESYYTAKKQQAEILNNLLGPQLKKFGGWLLVTAQTPLAIIVLAGVAMLAALWIQRKHGAKLRGIQNGADLERQRRQEASLRYREDIQSAADERLEDVDQIRGDYIYWQSAFDASSVKQLADLFHRGRPVTDDEGNIVRDESSDPLDHTDDGEPIYPARVRHRGVADLEDADTLRDTWLEPILRRDMLGSPDAALSQTRRALRYMTARYGHPEYRATLGTVDRLLDDLTSSSSSTADIPTSTQGPSGGPAMGYGAAGGDD